MVMEGPAEGLPDIVALLALLDIVGENLGVEAVGESILVIWIIAFVKIFSGVQLAAEHVVRHPHTREHEA